MYVCSACNRARVKEHRLAFRERDIEAQRGRARKHKLKEYGLTHEMFQQMVLNQHGLCAICFEPFGNDPKNCCIDHDHGSDRVRGLLCKLCNMALGCFREKRPLFVRAVQYLDWYEQAFQKAA
jgi:hypothetical protein